MPAGLEALSDDRIDAMRFEPPRFVYCGRRRKDLRAVRSHARKQFGRRQAEMKADNGRFEVLEQVGGLGAERRAQDPCGYVRDVKLKLPIIRGQHGAPPGFAFGIGPRRRVAEEVDVVRPCCVRGDVLQFLPHGVGTEHRAGKRAEAARVRNGNGQAAVLDTGHGCLNDREVDAQECLQCHDRRLTGSKGSNPRARCEINFWRVLSANSPTGCSAKSPCHG